MALATFGPEAICERPPGPYRKLSWRTRPLPEDYLGGPSRFLFGDELYRWYTYGSVGSSHLSRPSMINACSRSSLECARERLRAQGKEH